MSELAIRSIFGLFDKWGHENYIGENVTQLQHSQQVKTDNTDGHKVISEKKLVFIGQGCSASRNGRV